MKKILPLILFATSVFATEKPNLIIVVTDEHNFRTIGAYRDTLSTEQAFMWGDAVVETPYIDSIAKSGALSTSFYATTPVCSPSRGAFQTGVYPQLNNVVKNDIEMNKNIPTFADVLKQNGYMTGFIGKWHLSVNGKPGWAPKYNYGWTDNKYMFNRGHWKKLNEVDGKPDVATKNSKGEYTSQLADADEKSFTTDFLTDRAIEFIERHKDKPFTLMLSIPDPHTPNTVREPYASMYKNLQFAQPRTYDKQSLGVDDLPSWGQPAVTGTDMSQYFGMVKCIDDNVGKILETLEANNLTDNTIVLFTSDHGDFCGEHHRDNKGPVYEASAKIPFVIFYKGKIKAGTIIDQAMNCIDFKPTILGLMGIKNNSITDGTDFSKVFTGEAKDNKEHLTFIRGPGNSWNAAISDRYKLVASRGKEVWLLDLEKDPDELINFIRHPEYKGISIKMAKALLNYAKIHKDPMLNYIRDGLEIVISGNMHNLAEPKKPNYSKMKDKKAQKELKDPKAQKELKDSKVQKELKLEKES